MDETEHAFTFVNDLYKLIGDHDINVSEDDRAAFGSDLTVYILGRSSDPLRSQTNSNSNWPASR